MHQKPWFNFFDDIPHTVDCPETTLYSAFSQCARTHAELLALEYMGTNLTYARLLELVDTAADSLHTMGITHEDTVLIAMPNTPNAIVLFYALNKLGARVAMVHPLSPAQELLHFIRETKSRWAVTVDMFAQKFLEILNQTDVEKLLITKISDFLPKLKAVAYNLTNSVKLPQDSRILAWNDFMCAGKTRAETYPKSCYEAAVILFSGGTTDMPKGILLSDYAFNALAVSMKPIAKLAPKDRIMAILPIFHGFGLGLCVHTSLTSGANSILIPKFSADNYINSLIKQKPQYIVGVPTLFEALLRHPSFSRVRFDTLKGAYSGGDTLSYEIKQKFDNALRAQGSKVDLLEGYGTTESVTACVLTPARHYRRNSIGVPMPNTDMCVCAEDSIDVLAPGVEGEICVAGPQLMLGYLNDPEETARTLRVHADGKLWLHTGDAGYMDEDGYLFFKSRIKRIIKVSGMNVYPAQVERVLESHPAVWRACVVGIPDDYQMMSIKAFIVLRDKSMGSDTLVQELQTHCANELIKWSVPRKIEFLAEMPTTLVGKVAYTVLEKSPSPASPPEIAGGTT